MISDLFTTGEAFSLSQAAILPMLMAPGNVVQIDVIYQPTAIGSVTGTLVLQNNDPNTPQAIVALGGTGIAAPVVGVQPAALIFPPIDVGQTQLATLALANLGLLDLTVTALTVTGSGFTPGLNTGSAAGTLAGRD
jgi:hypothetical protein